MKSVNMSMSADLKRVRNRTKQPLSGGICRKPLSPERIRELNRIKYQQRKAEKELREWEKFCETLKSSVSLTDKVREIRSNRPSSISPDTSRTD